MSEPSPNQMPIVAGIFGVVDLESLQHFPREVRSATSLSLSRNQTAMIRR